MAEWRFGLQDPVIRRSPTPSKVRTTAVRPDRTTCEPNEEGGALSSVVTRPLQASPRARRACPTVSSRRRAPCGSTSSLSRRCFRTRYTVAIYARSLRGNLLDDGIGLHNRHARCVRRAVLRLQFDLRRSILHLRPLISKVKLRQSLLPTRRSRRQQCPTQNGRRRGGEPGRSARRDDMLRVLKDRKRGRTFPR